MRSQVNAASSPRRPLIAPSTLPTPREDVPFESSAPDSAGLRTHTVHFSESLSDARQQEERGKYERLGSGYPR